MAPVLTIMEAELLHKMRLLVGWEDGDGIFTPGELSCYVLGSSPSVS